MVSTPLRQFLESLCCNSPWDYAVFWKFQQHQNELLLIWEDGLCGISRPMNPMKGLLDSFDLNYSNEKLASTCAASIHSGNLSNGQLGVAIAEMSSVYYVIGKGLIGEVAYMENPSWISVDNFMADGISSNIISDCPVELFHQFVAGIKTILLVPLVPHGVLQLGSLDMVEEDDEMVINVKNKYISHQQLAACSTELIASCMENLGSSCCPAIIKIDEDLELSGDVTKEDLQVSDISQIISIVQDSNQISTDMMTITDEGGESNTNMQGVIDFTEPVNHQMWEFSESEILLNRCGFSCFDEELECLSNFSGYSMKNCQNLGLMLQSYSDNGNLVLGDCGYASCPSETQILKFPTDCELHKALGHAPLNQPDLSLSDKNATVSSVCSEDTTCINVSADGDSGGRCPDSIKAEYLLEAVVANTHNTSDDSSSNRTHSTTLKSSSLKLGSSQARKDALSDENQVPQSCVTSVFSEDRNSKTKISPSASSFGCTINALLEEPHRNGERVIRPTTGSKVTDGSKRRARTADCHKPRPRDRQLIQDRIKELRELVPNGAKCSIDGLLERTIKHMQFLTSVTDRADKVRRHTEKKPSVRKDVKSPKLEGNNRNGTSWALELENELQMCPIFVKDLEYPGHMLIEMLCNDDGRFLEIADVIHRLDLTILNGYVEKRSDHSAWARFIVEASESFHRLDVFWPLMQLLQQNRTQISSKI